MRQLTFPGFIRSYVRSLSLCDSTNIRKLAAEAASDNPRLREPLLLYADSVRKTELLRSAHEELAAYYGPLLDRQDLAELLSRGELPAEYAKVWTTFLSLRDRPEADAQTKEWMRRKLLRIASEKGISNYRMYTDLHLNPGNVNAWLKHGADEKVSLDTARRILEYVSKQ